MNLLQFKMMSRGRGGINSIPYRSPQLDALVALWKIDEASGQRNASFGGIDLTATGSVPGVAGKDGNAASFTDNTTFLTSTPILTIGQDTKGVTWVTWIKRSANPSINASPFSQGESLNPAWEIRLNNAGKCIGFIRDANSNICSIAASGLSLCDNLWHLTFFVWNENHDKKLHWYVPDQDLSLVSAATGTSELLRINAINSTVHVGIGPGTSEPWGGGGATALVDECMIFGKALSAAERVVLFNNGAGKFWPF